MERREFVRLVVASAVAIHIDALGEILKHVQPKPLETAFHKVTAETGYTDDIILRMYEEGKRVVIETKRRVTLRECFDLKHCWEKSIGLYKDNNPMDFDRRDVYVRPMTEELPSDSVQIGNKDSIYGPQAPQVPIYEVKYPDGRGGGEVMMDEVMIVTMTPNPGPVRAWSDNITYEVVDEVPAQGGKLSNG